MSAPFITHIITVQIQSFQNQLKEIQSLVKIDEENAKKYFKNSNRPSWKLNFLNIYLIFYSKWEKLWKTLKSWMVSFKYNRYLMNLEFKPFHKISWKLCNESVAFDKLKLIVSKKYNRYNRSFFGRSAKSSPSQGSKQLNKKESKR